MARVLLINPPMFEEELFTPWARATASVLPPLGLGYLAAVLEAKGHTVRIHDGIALHSTIEEVLSEARGKDVVGITAVTTFARRTAEVIEALKKHCRVPIVAGGPHTTILPGHMLEAGADAAVIGEGEETLLELVEALSLGRELEAIPGLCLARDGRIVSTGRRTLIEPLDSVPMPSRHLLPMHLYGTSPARAVQQPSHSMLSGRGCTGNCTFCNKAIFGTRVRSFSPGRIVGEMFLLRDRYGARDVALWDDNFTACPEVVFPVCEELGRRGFATSWSCESRIDTITREMLVTMKGAGLNFIAYGIESGSPRVLTSINKRYGIEDVRAVIRMTKEVGIPIRAYFMTGLPGETSEDIETTIRFAREIDVEIPTFTMFLPLPGTVAYRRAQEEDPSFDPEYYRKRLIPEIHFLDYPVFVPRGMTAGQLMALHHSAYRACYLNPRAIWRTVRGVRSVSDARRIVRSACSLAPKLLAYRKGGDR